MWRVRVRGRRDIPTSRSSGSARERMWSARRLGLHDCFLHQAGLGVSDGHVYLRRRGRGKTPTFSKRMYCLRDSSPLSNIKDMLS
jgi:hypothetical protein